MSPATDTGTGTINDDETKPYVIVSNASVQEGDSGTTTLTFTARLTDENGQTKASKQTVTASYSVLSELGRHGHGRDGLTPRRVGR